MSDLRYWLWLASLPIGARAARRYLRELGSVKELFLAGEEVLRQTPGAKKNEVLALCRKDISGTEAVEQSCQKKGIRVLCLRDADYPDRLRNIDDPPIVIYVKGTLPPVDDRLCIGVVGTRKATEYGLETAERIGGELAAVGAVVVTGLAEGIDSAAARGALKNRGDVIAVLGTGVDRVYPSWNTQLQEAVAEKGALVSEYPPGTGSTRYSFPRRNRIISGLSLGVAVVQAPVKSGALITAGFAQDQGRDVFVVPGAVDDPGFQGSNALIRDGAQLIRGSGDIVEEYRCRYPEFLRPRPPQNDENRGEATKEAIDKADTSGYISLTEQLESLSEEELRLIEVLAKGVCYADVLIRRSGLEAQGAMAALTMLQLRGYVREEYGRYRLLVQPKDAAGV
ncbi:MAG: DNA-processing protein DprA [Oscillospiraceae bacterium]|nr:DNA-processing protein DprA [Oscillospiraceae bacterium]